MLLNKILLNKILSNRLYKMSQYFPKPHYRLGGIVKVELDFYNYLTKFDLKEVT